MTTGEEVAGTAVETGPWTATMFASRASGLRGSGREAVVVVAATAASRASGLRGSGREALGVEAARAAPRVSGFGTTTRAWGAAVGVTSAGWATAVAAGAQIARPVATAT